MTPKFQLGNFVATPNALAAVSAEEVVAALKRHLQGDWGDLDEHDRAVNDEGLQHADRLLSAYHTQAGVKFWIITEADRSVTTVLLPDEY